MVELDDRADVAHLRVFGERDVIVLHERAGTSCSDSSLTHSGPDARRTSSEDAVERVAVRGARGVVGEARIRQQFVRPSARQRLVQNFSVKAAAKK
jgi:hypothetical protein